MVAIFVSHSKHDVHLRKYFSEIFASIGLKAYFMEWHDLDEQYAGDKISRMIRGGLIGYLRGYETSAVFVLLGENLANPPTNTPEFTHNWVTFEVGSASSCLKPVWVFEEFNTFIQFPIPFVTDYVQYELDSIEHLRILGKIFKEKIMYPGGQQTIKPTHNVKCPYKDCNAEYRYWSKAQTINCPVCRREIVFT